MGRYSAGGRRWSRRAASLGSVQKARKNLSNQAIQNAMAINSLNRRVGGLGGLELKFIDRFLVAGAINNPTGAVNGENDPATFLCLNSMEQGNGASNRVGREITMKSLRIQMSFTRALQEAQDTPNGDHWVFWALVLDTQTNEVQMSSEDCFQNPSANVATNIFPTINMEGTDQFRVIRSGLIKLPIAQAMMAQGAVDLFAHGPCTVTKSIWVNLKGKKAHFKLGTGANVTSIQDNSYHIICFSNLGNATVSYASRLRYTST